MRLEKKKELEENQESTRIIPKEYKQNKPEEENTRSTNDARPKEMFQEIKKKLSDEQLSVPFQSNTHHHEHHEK